MEWIPCKERLPDKNGVYFVTFIFGEYVALTDKMHYYTNGNTFKWTWDNYNHRDMTCHVVAWMPFPEPYMENNI